MSDTTNAPAPDPRIAEAAKALRPDFDDLLATLRQADELVASVHVAWKAPEERFNEALKALQEGAEDPDEVFRQFYDASGYEGAERCIGWLQERTEDMHGGWGGNLDHQYPAQRYGWLEAPSATSPATSAPAPDPETTPSPLSREEFQMRGALAEAREAASATRAALANLLSVAARLEDGLDAPLTSAAGASRSATPSLPVRSCS